MFSKNLTITPTTVDRDGACAAQQLAAASNLLLNGALSTNYDRDGICASQTPSEAGNMTLGGAVGTSVGRNISQASLVSIYSAANVSTVTFLLTGLDENGVAQTDLVTGPNATTAWSTTRWTRVDSVYASGACAGAVEVGWGGYTTFANPCHVSIYSAGNLSAITFTVYGLDRYGNSIYEAITGPNATTVWGAYNFASIYRVAASAAVGTNVEVGNGDEFETQWIPVDYRGGNVTIGVSLSSGASMKYTVQYTHTNVLAANFIEATSTTNTFNVPTLTGATASGDESTDGPVRAVRLKVFDWVSGTIYLDVLQANG